MTNNGECTSSGVPDPCCTGYQTGSCTGYSAAAIADMNDRLADWVAGLYAAGNLPIIVGMGVGPRDGLGDTDGALYGSSYTALSRNAEAIITPYWQTKGYHFIPWMTDAAAYGMTNAYVVGQGQCISGTCDPVCNTAHGGTACPETGSYDCVEGQCAHPSTNGWIYESGLVKKAIMQGPVQITTTSLPNATSGQPYSTALSASGGSGTGYAWSVSSGSLPTGFSFSPAGVLTSTGSPPAPANSYNLTVQVTDSAGNTATQPLTLTVFPSLPTTPESAVSGGGGGGGGCFIATAAFGSYFDPYVMVLRSFRDTFLLTNHLGRSFVLWYYRVSPSVAETTKHSESLRAGVRVALLPVVGFSALCLKIGLLPAVLLSVLLLLVLTTLSAVLARGFNRVGG
jgi:hypothetical protein